MANSNEPPLDEIQWRSPQIIAGMGGLHSNTILFYFAESPFFERTSNNAVVMNQALNNASMYHYIATRDAFEGRLKTMSGLEFIVGEEPAISAPGMGTGVWVIRKQTRRKRFQEDDEVIVHSSYFVVGENIYMAPSLMDILASRVVCASRSFVRPLTRGLPLNSTDDNILCHCQGTACCRECKTMATIHGPRISAADHSTHRPAKGYRIQARHPYARRHRQTRGDTSAKERRGLARACRRGGVHGAHEIRG